MVPPVDPGNKQLLFVLLFVGIIIIGLILYAGVTSLSTPGPEKSNVPTTGTPVNTVTIPPQDYSTTRSTNTAVPTFTARQTPAATPVRTTTSTQNPTPSPVISEQPTANVLPVMPGPVVPRPFSLSVSPESASGKPGETISYTLRIDGGEGQTEPIHFTLKASALFFSQTYEIGDEQPPFPKTSVYQFTIPGNIPSGITINGVITGTGAGQTREQPVTLKVL
jgi:hypothetical protein